VRILVILGVVGRLLRAFSAAFIPPILLALWDQDYDTSLHFALALVAAFLVGTFFAFAAPVARMFHRSEALAVVAGTWFIVAAFAGFPYVLEGLAPVDALFESMSGLTTTGATILQDFGAHTRAFFLWRAMTQWFGGIGVIALFVVVLPQLGVAGRQLFFAEASEVTESVSPQIHKAALKLWILYGTLTLLLVLLLAAAGFTPFDAVVHSFTTLSAGGFSPHPESIAGYANPAAEWVLALFMLLAGTSFPLLWKACSARPSALARDEEFRFYFGAMVLGGLAVAAILAFERGFQWDQVRAGLFQSASLISSTGFASVNYDEWSDGAKAILVAIMLVNGCAGSAAGGAKAIRHLIAFKFLRREVTQMLHPYAVLPLRYGFRVIPPGILRSVVTLVAIYIVGYLAVGILVVVLGADLVTGFSAALACLGNIGPGFDVVGPMGTYAHFPVASKIVLTLAMWVGRLEIVTMLALLHPHVWRNLQLSGRR